MSRFLRELPAWGISLVVNLSVLTVLHFIVFEQFLPPQVYQISSVVDEVPQDQELSFAESVEREEVGSAAMAVALAPSMKTTTALGESNLPLQKKLDEIINPEMPRLAETSIVDVKGNMTAMVEIQGQSDDVVGGVEGAMDRIAFEIRQSLHERKTLVIWLMDASGSLKERRQQIADRFDKIYQQLSKTGTTEGLYSVVVSYGEIAKLLTPEATQSVQQLSDSVRHKIDEDQSGIENVFQTVKLVLDKFHGFRKSEGPWNKMIFVVTDERGDDAEQFLEDVIAQAKRSQTRVYTIGNAAVFGRKEGYVRWRYEDGFVDYIPVDQGPETAFPDAIQLPFFGSGNDWRLRQMTASYGPYALTRLCAETGGLFLITESTPGISFERAVMRRYAPDYRPVRTQELEINQNPAKRALVTVSGMTYDGNLPLPAVVFRGYNDNILRTDLSNAQRPVAQVDYMLRGMYEALSAGERARDSLREDRWRAAFDLAMGRLLAMRVRYFGYNQMLANMKVSPKSFQRESSNMWRLEPAPDVESGPEMRKAAEQAKTYLQRVMKEHAGTPWAELASRELKYDLGWTWEEFSQPIPGTDNLRPNEEELARLMRKNEPRRDRRQPDEKERQRPKL